MYYIYSYKNKKNGKRYIGQTISPPRRKSEHKYAAFTSTSPEYDLLFHRKLREYGEDGFEFEILEEINSNDLNLVDEREIYWINFYKSYVKMGEGYNLTLGSQGKGRHKVLEEEKIDTIINLLENTKMTYKQINAQEGISLGTIVNINNGNYPNLPDRKYPIRKRFITQEEKEKVSYLLKTTKLTRQQIADEVGVSLSTVERIKAGTLK